MTAQWTPPAAVLADLDLVLTGTWPPGRPFTVDPPSGADEPVELLDPEGVPLAVHDPATGSTTPLAPLDHGPFRRLHLSPAQVHERLGSATPTVRLVTAPPSEDDVAAVTSALASGPVVVVACVGPGTPRGVSGVALVRASLAAFGGRPGLEVVAASVAARADPTDHEAFVLDVGRTFGPDVAVLPGTGTLPAAVREEVGHDRPAPAERGLVVLFTGLSGSGKSTIARALHDRLLERTRRTVTTLDGDVVRHHLSRGLGFSREDRETNIVRIGWVAAEVARHRGVAICSPIAPFASTRATVRGYVEDAGGTFALVHVATPLAECERRDRKGLYAKARAGEIPEFTGISSPYDEPDDALVRVDTTGRDVGSCLDDVLDALVGAGLLEPGVRDAARDGDGAARR
ncbi:adenylyl-sulfate kinase [Solicola sp. PLA-1-18]|uniref:adenylyl-sulfate kinase n=1 Tax=Solicola sp. PLA-1-18 TaxID=3380532 RepID=UPI003B7F22B5